MDEKTAVIVIDMLNDFLYGKLKCERCHRIIPCIDKLLVSARERGIPVIYVCDAHKKNDNEFKKWPRHAVEETRGAEIISELKPLKGDYIIKKTRYSGFFNTELEKLLKKLNVECLIITGILTNICVQHTVADAFFRDYKTIIPKECTEALSDKIKKDSFNFMKDMYNANIISIEDII